MSAQAMKSSWESRDWNDTVATDRVQQLSPFECSVLDAIRDGRTVTVHPDESSGKPDVTFGQPVIRPAFRTSVPPPSPSNP